MPTTTATTPPPSAVRPPLDVCVRERIGQLYRQGLLNFTLEDFAETAKASGHALSWIGDHLIVLQGLGVLHPAGCSINRAWTIDPGSEYLR